MTPLDAYNLTLSKVKELENSGIVVKIKTSRSRKNQKIIKKYNRPDRVSPDKWIHVSFKTKDKIKIAKIFDAGTYLSMCGISFDTGGCCDLRDWELDWSFSYEKGTEKWEWNEARSDVENMIENMSSDQNCDLNKNDE
jgi:hypothetical protein